MRTILLIDDDEACRTPAAELLRRDHWHVIEAEDGGSGLDLAVKSRPDVILCDLLMPRVNGYQVCRAVREHLELRHTKIIVVTGRDYASDRKSAEEAGADGYIVKPLEIPKLKELLDRLLPAQSSSPDTPTPVATNGTEPEGTLLRFWGVRGSIPSPGQATVFFGGNTSCVELRTGGRIVILDAGSGIRPLGLSLVEEFPKDALDLTLLITHTHWDHIQGFPFFSPAYDSRNRIRIYGYEGAMAGLRSTLAGQMESPYFPVALSEMPGNLNIVELREMSFDLHGIKVEACFTNHPGVCVAYKLHTPDGTVVYIPDNETKRKTSRQDSADKLLTDFVRNADVLIMDSQYTSDEYQTHIGWGHGCIDEVVRMAVATKVKRLYTFHHDPAHDDRCVSSMLMHARQLAEAASSALIIEAAREGMEVSLRAGVVATR
jgi:phosphoribosyl 1,2-cyclic phosphodiesterase/CheY-like chemotaxis protein